MSAKGLGGYAGQTTSQVPVREFEVNASIASLDNSLVGLAEVVEMMCRRTESVQRQEPSQAQTDAAKEQASNVPIAETINSFRRRVNNMRDQLRLALDRLEI